MNNRIVFTLIGAAALFGARPTQAAIFSLSPADAVTTPSGVLTLDLMATGAKLGGFDLDFDFDATALTLTSYSFDPVMGFADEALLETGFNTFNLYSVSFADPLELAALQSTDSFRVATLTFTAAQVTATTVAPVTITRADYTDLNAGFYSDAAPAGAFVRIVAGGVPPPSGVPEPGTWVLLATGFGVAGLIRRWMPVK